MQPHLVPMPIPGGSSVTPETEEIGGAGVGRCRGEQATYTEVRPSNLRWTSSADQGDAIRGAGAYLNLPMLVQLGDRGDR